VHVEGGRMKLNDHNRNTTLIDILSQACYIRSVI